MHIRPPDSSFADYKARRSAFMKALVADTPGDLRARCDRMKVWLDANSPFSPEEKLANLLRAFKDEGIVCNTK
jgi:hypothetical protein